MSRKKIKIGNTSLESLPFVLGGNVFGWTSDEKTSFDILDQYLEKGFNFIDTADVYSEWVPENKGGESETIIGKWINSRKNRDKIILATKVGGKMDENHKGLKERYVLNQIDESLKRLQTDHIDIYYTHFDDLRVPVEEILGTYEKIIKMGKVRYIGASNISPERIESSMKVAKENSLPSYSVLQPEYNLYSRESYERDYKPLVEKYGFAVLSYYSLASGFLTGKYHSISDIKDTKREERLKDYFNERGINLLDTLRTIAQAKSVTPAQLALAWLINQPTVTAPIASVSKLEQLDILKAVDIKLSEEELRAFNNINNPCCC